MLDITKQVIAGDVTGEFVLRVKSGSSYIDISLAEWSGVFSLKSKDLQTVVVAEAAMTKAEDTTSKYFSCWLTALQTTVTPGVYILERKIQNDSTTPPILKRTRSEILIKG